jgi:hypothetical protein
MTQFFHFETDFIESLRCIPMQVRMKLDTCCLKLKLSHWQEFDEGERQMLVDLPCDSPEEISNYRDSLQKLAIAKTGSPVGELAIDPHPPWQLADSVPEETQILAAEFKATISVVQWSQLTPLQRFALIKLSRPSHENKNFLPALKEFGLKI